MSQLPAYRDKEAHIIRLELALIKAAAKIAKEYCSHRYDGPCGDFDYCAADFCYRALKGK